MRNSIMRILTVCLVLIASTNCFASTSHGSILEFVSLGMPDNTLRAYLIQAKKYHIPVIIRGLYTAKNDHKTDSSVGSFTDTANRIFNLLKKQKNKKLIGGVSINPLLFRVFQIHTVPAMVITLKKSGCLPAQHQSGPVSICTKNRFDVIYGNIPINKQLEILAQKSDSPTRALIAKERYQP